VAALPEGAAAGTAPVLIVTERTSAPFFVAARVEAKVTPPSPPNGATLALPAAVLAELELAAGSEIAYLPLPSSSA
jgi:isopenicillin N synthase-like dioxygenase